LTIKSDDVVGRARAFEAIVKGTDIPASSIPESFKVLVKELQSLGLNVIPTGVVSAPKKNTTLVDDTVEEAVEKEAQALAVASGETVVGEGEKTTEPVVIESKGEE